MKSVSMRRTTGFTMVEMLIGIAILALTMALALPNYNIWIQNSKIRNAAESISSGLKLARSEAVRRNVPVQLSLGDGSSWIVGCETVVAVVCPATIQSRATGEGSSSVVTVDAGGVDTVTFNNLGQRIVPAVGRTTINVDSMVLDAADSRDLRITIEAGGIVLMCDPNVSAPDSRACPV